MFVGQRHDIHGHTVIQVVWYTGSGRTSAGKSHCVFIIFHLHPETYDVRKVTDEGARAHLSHTRERVRIHTGAVHERPGVGEGRSTGERKRRIPGSELFSGGRERPSPPGVMGF